MAAFLPRASGVIDLQRACRPDEFARHDGVLHEAADGGPRPPDKLSGAGAASLVVGQI
jgi:hypothetical protein